MCEPVSMLLYAGIAAEGGSMFSQYQATNSKLAMLSTQAKQEALIHVQKTMDNIDSTSQLLDAQAADASARGYSADSPSFNAIQRNSVNTGAKTQSNIDIQDKLEDENIENEKSNVKNALWGQLFSDIAGAAVPVTQFYAKYPTTKKIPGIS